MVENPNGSNVLHQDLEQIHKDDLEAMDLKWQLSLLSVRAKKYYQRTGKKIFINGNDITGYDKSKVECYNCHKLGHLARECRAPRSKEGQFRNQDNTRKQGNNEDTSKAMLAIDGVDSEVYTDKTCSKTCLKNYETLKKQYDDLLTKLHQTEFKAITYKRGLDTVEAQLVTYRKNEVLFSEEVGVLKREVGCKQYEINMLKTEFKKVKQEKDGIDFKIEKFGKASKDLDQLLGSQITDKSKKGLGYSEVPLPHPLIYNRPNKLDLSYSGLDEFKEPEFKGYGPENSKKESNVVCKNESDKSKENSDKSLVKEQVSRVKSSFVEGCGSNTSKSVSEVEPKQVWKNDDALIIEDWVSDDEEQDESMPKPEKKTIIPTAAKIEKPVKKSVRYAEMYRSQSPRGNQRNWNGQKSNQLGKDFVMYNKACYICGSFNHLQNNCHNHQRRGIVYRNNYNRVDAKNTHPNVLRNMSPKAVLLKTGLTPLNIARSINTAHPKTAVRSAKSKTYFSKQAHSTAKRPFYKTSLTRRSLHEAKRHYYTGRYNAVNTARSYTGQVNVVRGKPQLDDKGFVNSGCSRHMTGNIAYLSDFKQFDGGYVAFGGGAYGGKISGKGTLKTDNLDFEDVYFVNELKFNLFSVSQMCDKKNYVLFTDTECLVLSPNFKLPNENQILLKIPRKDNMYSFDMKNIVPKESLTCLVAKATLDESMLWHRRLGHINFKNINKLVKDNLTITWVFFLTTKDETSEILKRFIKEIENLVDKKVKIIRSDNGTEFKNKVMDDFCREKGIKREYSIARTPQQNGVAERRNRTLIEAARTMLADSKLPTTFWAEAVSTACTVSNDSAGTSEENSQDCIVMPIWKDSSWLDSPTKNVDNDDSSSKDVNAVGQQVNTVSPHVNTGFKDPDHPDKVYKVVKALYGLHQAPRAWYETLANYLLSNGFNRGKIDQTLFIKKQKGDILLVQVYVDDIIFGSTNKELCTGFEKLMKDKFQMSSMGELTFFLGLQVQQKEDGIFISQDKYVAEILKKFNYSDVKSASTPVDLEKPLVKDGDADDVDVHLYRSMIGSLMYLTASRPDIMFAVCACARFQVTPKTSHLLAVKRIFRYLKGKPTLGLWYSRDSPFELVAYTDSDYAGATLDRKSTTGGCQFLGNRLISWQCKKQTVVATSTTEAEYVAAASCCGQVGNEAVHKELGDRMEMAATTASSLEAEQDSGSGPRCQNTILGDVNAQTRLKLVLSVLVSVVKRMLMLPVQVSTVEGDSINASIKEIIDFLKASSVSYALTVNSVIYISCIEQFWVTSKVQTINGVRQIQALVNKKRVIVTESSIRRDLHLDDSEGTDYLLTATIFEELARIGYKKPSQKLTFYKAFFSPQWKYYIHTITQCLSAKSIAWNEFSSSMDSLIICLATNQKFNLSKYIFDAMVKHMDGGVKFLLYLHFLQVFINQQLGNMSTHKKIFVNPFHIKKVFANMKKAGKDFSRGITPLFDTMMVQPVEETGEDSDHPTDSTIIPIIDQPSSSSQPKKDKPSKKAQRSEAEVPQDETKHKESVPTPFNDPQPSGEDSMKLTDLMVLCTKLQTQVIDLQKAKDTQAKEIAALKKRIQRLERRKISRPTGLKRLRKVSMSRRVESSEDQESLGVPEDAFKQGRSIEDIDADYEVLEVVEMPVEAKVDGKDEQSTKTDDSTAGEAVTTADGDSVVPTTNEEVTLAQTLTQIKAAKPKVVTTAATTATTTRPKDKRVVVQSGSGGVVVRGGLEGVGFVLCVGVRGVVEGQKRAKSGDGFELDYGFEVQESKKSRKKVEKEHLKLHKEEMLVHYELIRADGSSKRYSSMIRTLQGIYREDLEALWRIVKVKYGDTRPEDEFERVLYGDLVTTWKLIDSSGVHFVKNRSRIGINKVLFSEEVVILKREVGIKQYEINTLKTEFEKLKQEKDGIEFKIKKFDKASKDLDQLLESQITDKSYGPENSKKESNVVSEKESDNSKENSDKSLVKEQESHVSDDEEQDESITMPEKKIVIPTAAKIEKPVKNSVRPRIVNTARSYRTPVNTVRPRIVNTARSYRTPVNTARSYRTPVNTIRPRVVNTARPNRTSGNAARANRFNAIKPSTCWVWRPIKPNSASITLNRYNYIDARGRSKLVMAWVPKGI
ncbi:putative ribonuclease H-like domain-containing protein [Tanacetum coccineum]